MSVYIKGMDIPKCCGDCLYRKKINPEENQCFLTGKVFDETFSILLERRHAECPLVPVPPHGRLIDADSLDDSFTDLRWENGDYKSGALIHWGDRPHWCLTGGEIENLINAAPTIIEAEDTEL